MNYRGEPYPTNVAHLVAQAEHLAIEIKAKLKDPSCPKINQLYKESNGKIRRQTQVFSDLGIVSNSHLGEPRVLKTGELQAFNEFKGLYILGHYIDGKMTPVYIGISRTVYRRIRQHGWGKNHNECTLAYLKLKEKQGHSRANSTNEDLEPYKKKIREFKVVLIQEQNDYNLYFLEVALAGIFKTRWNSFRTH